MDPLQHADRVMEEEVEVVLLQLGVGEGQEEGAHQVEVGAPTVEKVVSLAAVVAGVAVVVCREEEVGMRLLEVVV